MTEILIVDDDAQSRKYAKLALNYLSLGAQNFTEAEDQKMAIDLIKEKRFDLIIMDMELTDMGREGEQLIRYARGATPNQKIAIVGRSSNPDYEQTMLTAGADAFACKRYLKENPVDSLQTAVKKALGIVKTRDPENYAFFIVEGGVQRQP